MLEWVGPRMMAQMNPMLMTQGPAQMQGRIVFLVWVCASHALCIEAAAAQRKHTREREREREGEIERGRERERESVRDI